MFRSLKFYVNQVIDIEQIVGDLVSFGYRHAKNVVQPGDFARRGEVLDVFPSNFDSPIRIALDFEQIRAISSFNIQSGKAIWQHKIVIIFPLKTKKREPFHSETPLNHFVDIQSGDYVVHNVHGIGKYKGLKTIEINDQPLDHLVIEYLGGDKLFVPKHDMHLVQKYVGFHKRPPRIYKLGSKEWKRIKTRIQKKLQRMAAELLHLQAVRASTKGIAFGRDTPWQAEFEKQFPFTETPDQIISTQDVKKDMESPHPMDRLLCGDVGFGKTEVALRAAFKAVMSNKQVAVLVPTTILAEQHFYNFSNRLENYPVEVPEAHTKEALERVSH